MAEIMTETKSYDSVRRRIYGGILIFAVAVGILSTAVPALRARLFERIHILHTAMRGEAQPEIINMGENDIPYPEEFMRRGSGAVVSFPPTDPSQRPLLVQADGAALITTPVLIGAVGSGSPADIDKDDDSPRFQQGDIEREAYEITLAANEKLAAAVRSGDDELVFKKWGASRRNIDVYWVRVIFQNASGADVEYIWQTNISSGSVAPLNFNARNFQVNVD